MTSRLRRCLQASCGVVSLVFFFSIAVFTIAPGSVFAKKPPKNYPEMGRIVGIGIDQVRMSHTYKVETDQRIYELDCWSAGSFGRTGSECGGDKKLQIGDVIHFRMEKSRAYIPVAETISHNGEQALHVVREEVKSGDH